jgi:hypothetical protein
VDSTALALARVVEIYLALGLVFGIAFARSGVTVIDPNAQASTRGFRVLILPGAIALWPVLLRRWIAVRAAESPRPTRPADGA